MDKVQSKAADATLKAIAATALPLIKNHLQVSQHEMKDPGYAASLRPFAVLSVHHSQTETKTIRQI